VTALYQAHALGVILGGGHGPDRRDQRDSFTLLPTAASAFSASAADDQSGTW
jgi:hypothetical protein